VIIKEQNLMRISAFLSSLIKEYCEQKINPLKKERA